MPKKRPATMADVAKQAGVSRTAVSFVLNNVPDANIPESTRERILQAAHDLNYIPNVQALNLARGKTMMVALVIRQTSAQMSADMFMGEFIRGAMHAVEAQDYHLLVHAAEPDNIKTTYTALVRTRKVDGLLISSPLVKDPEVRQLHEEGTPIVLHGGLDGSLIPSVDVDNIQGAHSAVQHLIRLGHHRIGHISNAPFSYLSSVERLAGYKQALAEAHLSYDPDLVLPGAFTPDSGYALMQRLLDLPQPPTAVFIGSDVLSIGAVDANYDRGLAIPDDISIASFDDVLMSRYVRPPLTTVHLPGYDLGRTAGEMILSIIAGESHDSQRILLPTELIIRQSTAYMNPSPDTLAANR